MRQSELKNLDLTPIRRTPELSIHWAYFSTNTVLLIITKKVPRNDTVEETNCQDNFSKQIVCFLWARKKSSLIVGKVSFVENEKLLKGKTHIYRLIRRSGDTKNSLIKCPEHISVQFEQAFSKYIESSSLNNKSAMDTQSSLTPSGVDPLKIEKILNGEYFNFAMDLSKLHLDKLDLVRLISDKSLLVDGLKIFNVDIQKPHKADDVDKTEKQNRSEEDKKETVNTKLDTSAPTEDVLTEQQIVGIKDQSTVGNVEESQHAHLNLDHTKEDTTFDQIIFIDHEQLKDDDLKSAPKDVSLDLNNNPHSNTTKLLKRLDVFSHLLDATHHVKEQRAKRKRPCGICHVLISKKEFYDERRFGILRNCEHVFCYGCLRDLCHSPAVPLGPVYCPECRLLSESVGASFSWITGGDEKIKFFKDFDRNLCYEKCMKERFGGPGKLSCEFLMKNAMVFRTTNLNRF